MERAATGTGDRHGRGLNGRKWLHSTVRPIRHSPDDILDTPADKVAPWTCSPTFRCLN